MWVLLLLPAVCLLAVFLHSLHKAHTLASTCFVFFSVFDYFSCGSECKFSICSSVYVDVQHPTDYLNSIFEPSHSLGPLSLSRSLPVRNKLIYFSCFYFGITFTSLHTRGWFSIQFNIIIFLRFLSAVPWSSSSIDLLAVECFPVAVSSPNKRQPIILRYFFRFALFSLGLALTNNMRIPIMCATRSFVVVCVSIICLRALPAFWVYEMYTKTHKHVDMRSDDAVAAATRSRCAGDP